MAHITFISKGLSGGGMERAYSNLANHFANKGHFVSVVLLFRHTHFFSLAPNITLYEPAIDRKKLGKYKYAWKLLPFVRKCIRKSKADVIVSFGEWFNPYVILASRGLGIRLCVCDRMGPDLDLGILQNLARRTLYRLADAVIVQTEYAAKRISQRTGGRDIHVIPNPLTPLPLSDAIPKFKQIVSVGRLSREKGHKFLIEAFAKLDAPEWSLLLVGDGPERKSLEALTNSLGLADRVHFHGQLKDVSRVLQESSIFVLPSLYEGFPNALIEAMSVPLPCISSDCNAGPRDIINNGSNGLLVTPGDSDALAKQLTLLTKDNTLRNKLAEQAMNIRETLNFEKIAARYRAVILPTEANA